jgi:hypothetical protein
MKFAKQSYGIKSERPYFLDSLAFFAVLMLFAVQPK